MTLLYFNIIVNKNQQPREQENSSYSLEQALAQFRGLSLNGCYMKSQVIKTSMVSNKEQSLSNSEIEHSVHYCQDCKYTDFGKENLAEEQNNHCPTCGSDNFSKTEDLTIMCRAQQQRLVELESHLNEANELVKFLSHSHMEWHKLRRKAMSLNPEDCKEFLKMRFPTVQGSETIWLLQRIGELTRDTKLAMKAAIRLDPRKD